APETALEELQVRAADPQADELVAQLVLSERREARRLLAEVALPRQEGREQRDLRLVAHVIMSQGLVHDMPAHEARRAAGEGAQRNLAERGRVADERDFLARREHPPHDAAEGVEGQVQEMQR